MLNQKIGAHHSVMTAFHKHHITDFTIFAATKLLITTT